MIPPGIAPVEKSISAIIAKRTIIPIPTFLKKPIIDRIPTTSAKMYVKIESKNPAPAEELNILMKIQFKKRPNT